MKTHLCGMLTIGAAFYELKEELSGLYDIGEATAIAHGVLEHLTNLNRLERLIQKDKLLNKEQTLKIAGMKTALLNGTPLQYITGIAQFMGRSFTVNPAVLIPRPETEELVQWIIHDEQPKHILDIGTGSGCIAISLKLALPQSQVQAVDISVDALVVARKNAEDLSAQLSFDTLNFLSKISRDALPTYDVIVSNPPYIPLNERDSLHTNVRDYEPAAALFVPENNPLQFYQAIADFGLNHLSEQGSIYCEIHSNYAQETADLFSSYGYSDVVLRQDMHGTERMIRARLYENPGGRNGSDQL